MINKAQKKDESKVVLTILELSASTLQQRIFLDFASGVAQKLGLPMIVHPNVEKTNFSFKTGRQLTLGTVKNMEIDCTVSKQSTGYFTSINDIAISCNAELIIMAVRDIKISGIRKMFGKTIWGVATNTRIPVMMVSPNTPTSEDIIGGKKFEGFQTITLAVDPGQKVQKAHYLIGLVSDTTVVNLFIEKTHNIAVSKDIDVNLIQLSTFLSKNDIKYKPVEATYEGRYTHQLLRFAMASNSDLVAIEVDEGRLDNDLKQNLQKVLFGKNQRFAVILIRTK